MFHIELYFGEQIESQLAAKNHSAFSLARSCEKECQPLPQLYLRIYRLLLKGSATRLVFLDFAKYLLKYLYAEVPLVFLFFLLVIFISKNEVLF